MTDTALLHIKIQITQQKLSLFHGENLHKEYRVSTALNGTGEQNGSGCTPLGKHNVKIKIGHDCPVNSVFVGRRATGEIYSAALAEQHPNRDWILTRLLWLTGCDSGRNRGGNKDSLQRYIYIHGCPDSEPMGVPLSHGCIRMRNTDVIELFNQVINGTQVDIVD